MSHSLGPIHYMMYDKITRQDDLTAALLDDQPDFRAKLDARYAPLSREPLEKLINQDNIHGWLAAAIDQAEVRFAAALNHVGLAKALPKLEALGRQFAQGQEAGDVNALFEGVNRLILDGMPCDRALIAYEESGALVLHQEVAVHDGPMSTPFGEIDPADSLGKTCDGGHDHDHHESFELSALAGGAAREAGVSEGFYQARHALLKGYAQALGWRVTRDGQDFRFEKE